MRGIVAEGRPSVLQDSLHAIAEVKSRRILPTAAWLEVGGDARAFLRRGIRLLGEKYDAFFKAFLAAKTHASRTLFRNAEGDYKPDEEAARYPKFVSPNPERQFGSL